MCTLNVPRKCVHGMSPESVYIDCPQKVCTLNVPRKCVHGMSPESVYIDCPQKVCTLNVPRKCVDQVFTNLMFSNHHLSKKLG